MFLLLLPKEGDARTKRKLLCCLFRQHAMEASPLGGRDDAAAAAATRFLDLDNPDQHRHPGGDSLTAPLHKQRAHMCAAPKASALQTHDSTKKI